MSPEILGVIGLVLLIVLILFRMWIGAAMALVGFVGYALVVGLEPAFAVVAQIPYSTVADYTISTAPLFIYMGVILTYTNIGKDLYEAMYAWIGHLKGGLAMATVVACALFGAITGTSSAAIATLGKIAIPEMRKYKYSDTLSTGSLACAGTLAFLIPPSVGMIIYAILTEQSIGKLFIAGIFPGIMLIILFLLTIVLIVTINPKAGPANPKPTWGFRLKSLKGIWPVLVLFVLVLGGIYLGWFTPTEAGAIGAFGSIVIGLGMRRLDGRKLRDATLEGTQISAFVFLIIVGAYILMKFLAVSKLPFFLADLVVEFELSKYVVIIAVIVLYLILGMFLDVISAVILTMPVIFPILTTLGFDPIWIGVFVIVLIQIGLVTPPVGLDLFMLSGVTNVPLGTIFRGILPFIAAMLVGLTLIIIFPEIALWLPQTM